MLEDHASRSHTFCGLSASCERYQIHYYSFSFTQCVFCLAVGGVVGGQIVENIKGWVRAKPERELHYSFYLYALPISISVGLQAASLTGLFNGYLSMCVSFGLLGGIAHTLTNKKKIGFAALQSSKHAIPMLKVEIWDHFQSHIVWVNNYDTTVGEVIIQLANQLKIDAQHIVLEAGQGAVLVPEDYDMSLWQLKINNAINPRISFFGIHSLHMYAKINNRDKDGSMFVLNTESTLARSSKSSKSLKNSKSSKGLGFLVVGDGSDSPRRSPSRSSSAKSTEGSPSRKKKKGFFYSSSSKDESDDEDSPKKEKEKEKEKVGRVISGIKSLNPFSSSSSSSNKNKKQQQQQQINQGSSTRLKRTLSIKETEEAERHKKEYGDREVVRDISDVGFEEKVKSFVTMIMVDDNFQIVGIPDALEKKIYKMVLKSVITMVYKKFHEGVSKVKIFGHHLELDIEKGLQEYKATRHELDTEAVEQLVDTLLGFDVVNISWLPDSVEKKIYVSVILVVFTLIQNVVGSSTLDIIGHTFEAKFTPNGKGFIDRELLSQQFANFAASEVCHDTLSEYIDEMMEAEHTEAGDHDHWMPDMLEKAVFKGIFTLVLYVVKEVCSEINVKLLGDNFTMRLKPGEAHKTAAMIEKEQKEAKKAFQAVDRDGLETHQVFIACAAGVVAGSLFF